MPDKLVAGVDISKAFSDICVLSPKNEIILHTKINNDHKGMQAMNLTFKKLEADYNTQMVIIMEATAHYHQLLANFFRKLNYKVVVINPIQSNAIKNINIRKVKSDKTDSHNIALLYRLKNYSETETHTDIVVSIKKLCRQHKELTDEIVGHINRLTGFLDISFPDFKKIFTNLQGKTALTILSECPTVTALLDPELDKELLINQIKIASRKSETYAKNKFEELYEAAKSSNEICISNLSTSILIQTTVSVIFSLQEALRAIDDEISRLSTVDDSFQTNVELLQTIPGVGEYTACVLLSEIGNIKNFTKPKQLVAFFGLDPSVSQSGSYNRKNNRISKRGSPYVRVILHMLAKANVYSNRNREYSNPVMRDYFERKIAEKPYKVVMCAVMRKMVQIIFAVLRDQKPFELRTPDDHQKMIRLNNKKAA